MILGNKTVFAETGDPYNTIIGGQGENTTTAAGLEVLLGLSSGEVTYFNINGADIEAYINVVSYQIPADTFNGNLDITSYLDLDSLVTRFWDRCFKGASNFTKVQAYGVTYLDDEVFWDADLTGEVYFPLVATQIRASCFRNNTKMTKLDVPSFVGDGGSANCMGCTGLKEVTGNWNKTGHDAFNGDIKLSIFNLASLTVAQIRAFQGCVSLPSVLVLTNCLIISTSGFYGLTHITRVEGPVLTYLDGSAFFGNILLTGVGMPLLEYMDGHSLRGCDLLSVSFPELLEIDSVRALQDNVNLSLINIPKCVKLGNSVGYDDVFTGLPSGGTITVSLLLKTVNGGKPDGDLAWLEETKGWTINYV